MDPLEPWDPPAQLDLQDQLVRLDQLVQPAPSAPSAPWALSARQDLWDPLDLMALWDRKVQRVRKDQPVP